MTQNITADSETSALDNPRLEPWKAKILLTGGLVGLGAGLFSAYLLIKNSERSGVRPGMSTREGFRIAVLLIGAIRNVANLWEQ